MKNGLSRRASATDDIYETVLINVFDLKTKEIVFTGAGREVANFIGTSQGNMRKYLRQKTRYKKKYALRLAKTNTE